jgi:hypothetical protein
LLQTQQPDALAGVEYADHREKPVISDCGDYEVRLTEAFRFVNDDAIVFHLVIANRTDKAIEHAPERLEIRVADHVFNPSVTDLLSTIAPMVKNRLRRRKPGRMRNDLSLKNDLRSFSRRDPAVEINTPDSKDIEPAPLPQ